MELQLEGIQKQYEEITTFVEVLKTSTEADFILSMLDNDDIEGEYIYLIPYPDLTTSPDSNPRTDVKLSSTIETELPQETIEPTFRTNISQLVFTPSPSLEEAATNDQLESERSGEKSEDIVLLDLPSPLFLTF